MKLAGRVKNLSLKDASVRNAYNAIYKCTLFMIHVADKLKTKSDRRYGKESQSCHATTVSCEAPSSSSDKFCVILYGNAAYKRRIETT